MRYNLGQTQAAAHIPGAGIAWPTASSATLTTIVATTTGAVAGLELLLRPIVGKDRNCGQGVEAHMFLCFCLKRESFLSPEGERDRRSDARGKIALFRGQ
jgi:hypothetical protein